jgi:hypothetical protein
MARFLDETVIAHAREVRRRLREGAARTAEAIVQVEGLLRELGLELRFWQSLGARTIRSGTGSRTVHVSLGYSDEGDGAWGIKLRASDPRGAIRPRYVRLADCSQGIRIRLLPQLRRLVGDVVARARELADLIEQAVGDRDGPVTTP